MKIFYILSVVLILLMVNAFANSKITSHSLNESDSYYKTATEKAKLINYGKDRIIAVLDTGINDDNIELYGQVIAEYDATTNSDKAIDSDGHGTKIASVIAAKKDGKGITGVAYNAKLIDVKVVDDNGNIKTEHIISGIEFAVKNGANVINMSFSSGEYSKALEQTIEKHSKVGVLFVAAAGNDGSDAVTYPAGYKNVTAVSSLKRGTEERAIYANYGEYVDEYVDDGIWTFDGETYTREMGTSEATAIISSSITALNNKNLQNISTNIKKEYKLSSDGIDNISSIFEEDDTGSYLNSLADYIGSQNVTLETYDTMTRMQLSTLQKYDQSYGNAFTEIKHDFFNYQYSINNDQALFVVFDLYKMFVDSSAEEEYQKFVLNMQDEKGMNNLLTKYNKFISSYDNGEIEFLATINQSTITPSKYNLLLEKINDAFGFGVDHLAVGSNVFNEKLRKAYNFLYRGKNANWTSIKGQQNKIDNGFKNAKHFFFILNIFKEAYSEYVTSKKKTYYVKFLKLKSVEFFMMMGALTNESYDGTPSQLAQTFMQSIKQINSSKENLEATINELEALVGFNETKFVLTVAYDGLKTYYNKAFPAKLGAFPAFLAKVLVEGIFEIAEGEYSLGTTRNRYIISKELMIGLKFDSHYNANYQYLNHYNINEAYTSTLLIHKFLYNATSYLQQLGASLSSSGGFSTSDSIFIRGFSVTEDGAEYTSTAPNGILDQVVGTLTEMPKVTGKLLLLTNPNVALGLSTDDYMQLMCNDTKMNALFLESNHYGFNCSEPETSDLRSVFSIYSDLIHNLQRYEKALSFMLASKETYNDVSFSNLSYDKKAKIVEKIHALVKKYNPAYNTEDNAYIFHTMNQSLVVNLESKAFGLAKGFFEKLNSPIPRKDYFIMLLKASGINPYEDESFLRKLFIGELSQYYFTDMDKVLDGKTLTLNEKIWLIYGKYTKGVPNGYDDPVNTGKFEIRAFKNITREHAIATTGNLASNSGMPQVIQFDESNGNHMALLDHKANSLNLTDYDTVKYNDTFLDGLATSLLNGLASGVEMGDGTREMSLTSNITYYETSVVSNNFYAKVTNPNTMMPRQLGDESDKLEKPCSSPMLCTVPNASNIFINALNAIPQIYSNQSKTFTLHTSIPASYIKKLRFVWTSLNGEVTNFEKSIDENGYIKSSVNFIAPEVNEEHLVPLTVYIITGSGKSISKEYFVRVSPSSHEGVVVDDSNIQFSSTYLKNSNEFQVNWETQNIKTLEILYSFDNQTWTRYALLDLDNYQGNSSVKSLSGTENYNEIYFKTVATNSAGDQTTSNVDMLKYETVADTYVEKSSESPNAPSLSTLADSTHNNYVNLRWKRVNDSHNNDNVDYYEVKYADNYAFENAITFNAGNNAAGTNIYESCSFTVSNLEDDKKYYFRVRAYNSYNGGTYSSWSSYESIRIDLENMPSFDASNQSPLNSAIGVSKTPTFQWDADDNDNDPLEYYVNLGESPDNLRFGSGWILDIESVDFSMLDDKPLQPNTTYYWQVTVREEGHFKDYYGGEYITSPLWSFQTINEGADLGIISATPTNDIKPFERVYFNVTVKNFGTANVGSASQIKPYYKTADGTSIFHYSDYGDLLADLAPGESVVVQVRLDFVEDLVNANGEVYDNVLRDGTSSVVFKLDRMNEDTDLFNNEYEYNINYSTAENLPDIWKFGLPANNTFNKSGVQNYKLGWQVYYEVGAEDSLLLDRFELEYRTSVDDVWHDLVVHNNDIQDENYYIKTGWVLPENDDFITSDMQIRVKAYNSDVYYSQVTSKQFPVFSNESVSMDSFIVDRNIIYQGDNLSFNWNSDGTSKTLYIGYVKESNGTVWEKLFSTQGVTAKEVSFNYPIGTYDLQLLSSYPAKIVYDGNITVIKEPTQPDAPIIESLDFNIINNIPAIGMKCNGIYNECQFLRSYNEIYHVVGSVSSVEETFIDINIQYGTTYKYKAVAIDNGLESLPSTELQIKASLDEAYGVVIDSTDYQTLASNALTLAYHPSITPIYESYEVRLGTNPSALELYAITQNRTVSLEGLNYAETYYIEVYPVDYAGVRLSTVAAKLTFTTGFDTRPITGTINVSINEVAIDHISMSWNSVDNVSFYSICRSENGGDYECFDTTTELSYTDYINLEAGVSYTYIIQAMNGFTFNKSQASLMAVVPDPNLDTDGDGIPDYQDNRNDDGPFANPDGDGLLNGSDPDDDGDGMLDSCESQYSDWLDQWIADGDGDLDNDGFTNLEECNKGTSPVDHQDFPVNNMKFNPSIIQYLLG